MSMNNGLAVAVATALAASGGVAAPPDLAMVTADRVLGLGGQQIERAPLVGAGEASFVAEVAVDADFEFFLANGGDVDATIAAIEPLLDFATGAFEAGPGVAFEVTEIIVRTSADDPYTSSDPGVLFQQVVEEWSTNQSDVPHDVVVMFTGKNLNGAVLSVSGQSGLCTDQSVTLLAPGGLTDDQQALTLAHGLGHVFGAVHCDGQPDCGIMCATLFGCNGSMMFGQSSIDAMLALIDSSGDCLETLGGCPADFNDDGEVNVLDFIAFQAAFEEQDASADCNGDDEFNVLDFICFQAVFEEGCP